MAQRGLTAQAFCLENELRPASLYAWQRTLAKRDAEAIPFAQVHVLTDETSNALSPKEPSAFRNLSLLDDFFPKFFFCPDLWRRCGVSWCRSTAAPLSEPLSTRNIPLPTREQLPEDKITLQDMVLELLATVQRSRLNEDELRHRIAMLLRRIYGPRTERFDPNQGSLLCEAPFGPFRQRCLTPFFPNALRRRRPPARTQPMRQSPRQRR